MLTVRDLMMSGAQSSPDGKHWEPAIPCPYYGWNLLRDAWEVFMGRAVEIRQTTKQDIPRSRAYCIGEDALGNPALYWMSHRGVYRYGLGGMEYIGKGIEGEEQWSDVWEGGMTPGAGLRAGEGSHEHEGEASGVCPGALRGRSVGLP